MHKVHVSTNGSVLYCPTFSAGNCSRSQITAASTDYDWRVGDWASQGVPSINTRQATVGEDGTSPRQPRGGATSTLHGRTTFDTDSARPCVRALIAGARATRVPLLLLLLLKPPPPHKSAGDDGLHHCPSGIHDGIWRVQMRTVRQPGDGRYDLIQCVRSSTAGLAALESIFIKLGRRQTSQTMTTAQQQNVRHSSERYLPLLCVDSDETELFAL